ncbi:MAG: CPBP family intramembrane metalloprotease [Clostridia bacterium]|nr:CPBP family intramembrane metalloprotease [Clostridia bacterium]
MKRGFIALVKAILFLLFFELVMQTIGSLYLQIIRATAGADYVKVYYYYANMLTIVADVVSVGVLLLLLRRLGFGIKDELGVRPITPLSAGACLVAGVALLIFVNILLAILPIPEDWWSGYSSSTQSLSRGPLWAQILFTCVAAPVCEEIVFRGLVYNTCRRAMPMALAVIIGALFFGAIHNQVLWISYAVFCGFFLVMAYEVTGSLYGSILMHVGFNAFSKFCPSGINFLTPLWLLISAAVLVVCFALMVNKGPVRAIEESSEVSL